MAEWTCQKCTLVNENPTGLCCELCQSERISEDTPSGTSDTAGGSTETYSDTSSNDEGQIDFEEKSSSSAGGGKDVLSDDTSGGESSTGKLAAAADLSSSSPVIRLNRGKRSAVVCLDDSSSSYSDSSDEDDEVKEGENDSEVELVGDDDDDDDDSSVELIESISELASETSKRNNTSCVEHAAALPFSSKPTAIQNPYSQQSSFSSSSRRRPRPSSALPSTSSELLSHANAVLRRHWGSTFTLKPFQLGAIEALWNNRDALIVSGTGSGKSVCYQLPPLLVPGGGVAVVVSPLISLMRDQCYSLQKKGISAEFVGSGQDDIMAEERALNGEASVIFVCPESLPRIGRALKRLHDRLFSRQVITATDPPPMILACDECHCVSSWGHDFRPAYQQIGPIRDTYLPRAPCVALTATATPRVRDDVSVSLRLRQSAYVAIESFDRPNLHYTAKHCEDNEAAIIEITKLMCPILDQRRSTGKVGPSAIIYCPTRNDCEDVAKKLNEALHRSARNNGWRPHSVLSEAYHAGLPVDRREDVQSRWTSGKTIVVCATIAFGMGIDKPDVRLCVHSGWPQSLEAYFQESGRAGRDGLPARCVLLIPSTTVPLLLPSQGRSKEMSDVLKKNLWRMHDYGIRGSGCRRRNILGYFGQSCAVSKAQQRNDNYGCCDMCDRRDLGSRYQRHASIRHLPLKADPLLEPAVRTIRALIGMGATDLSTGAHAVKPNFVQLADESGVSSSWKWCRGLCRVLLRDGWLGRDICTITFTKPKARRKKKGKRKRKKRRSKQSAPTTGTEMETIQKRVEVVYVTSQGKALIAFASGERNNMSHYSVYEDKVRHALSSKLICWPDLDMIEETKSNPRHLKRVAGQESSIHTSIENAPPQLAAAAAASMSNEVSTSAGKLKPHSNNTTSTGLIGWKTK